MMLSGRKTGMVMTVQGKIQIRADLAGTRMFPAKVLVKSG